MDAKTTGLKYTRPPWLTDGKAPEGIVMVTDSGGMPIAACLVESKHRPVKESLGNAHLLGYAAEFYERLEDIDELRRRKDPAYCAEAGADLVTEDDWKQALEEIGALLEVVKEGA